MNPLPTRGRVKQKQWINQKTNLNKQRHLLEGRDINQSDI
jgi:hypothetical protein